MSDEMVEKEKRNYRRFACFEVAHDELSCFVAVACRE